MEAYGVLRGFSLGGSTPQTTRQGGSAPLDLPMKGLVTPQYGDCVQDGLATPQDGLVRQDGLVTPPLWGLRADLFKKRPKFWKNISFLLFFHQGAQSGCKSRKTCFYVFCFFTPLYGRFRLSRASQTIDIEKIYRLVLNNPFFMPCGSVFGRLCVQCKNFIASALKLYGNLSKFYRNSIEILLKFF